MKVALVRQLGVLLIVSFLAVAVPAQYPAPRTVLDYYKLLPDKFFEADRKQRIDWMLDRKRGAIVDEKRGYLFAPGDGAQSDVILTLFKMRRSGYVVGVKHYAVDTNELTYLEFYTYSDGAWTEVTKSVLPMKIDHDLRYELSRYGTTIRVTDKRGRSLHRLVWSGQRFRRQR